MKIIVTATSSSIEAEFDARFGRGAFFIVVDTETMEWKAVANPGVNAHGGAGTLAAQFASDQNVAAVISGSFGPNAYAALSAAGISMYANGTAGGIVRDVIGRFKA